jgi:hypothetical protein
MGFSIGDFPTEATTAVFFAAGAIAAAFLITGAAEDSTFFGLTLRDGDLGGVAMADLFPFAALHNKLPAQKIKDFFAVQQNITNKNPPRVSQQVTKSSVA